jgi:hypothetical protein
MLTSLIAFTLRQVLGDGIDAVSDLFLDHPQSLLQAIQRAHERTWQSLAIVVVGDSLLDRVKTTSPSGEDKEVAAFLRDTAPLVDWSVAGFRQACQVELKSLKKSSLFAVPGDSAGKIASLASGFRRLLEGPDLIAEARQAVGQSADALHQDLPNLSRLLVMPSVGIPLLAALFAWFFKSEVEQNPELARKLIVERLWPLVASHAQSFSKIEQALLRLGDRVFDLVGATTKRDYYEVLGVSRDADEATLKKAYRKLATHYHPDRNPGDAEADAKFKEAAEAFEVLRDPQKRQRYDRYGHVGLEKEASYDFANADSVMDLFGEMFGDIFGGGRRRPDPHQGNDIFGGRRCGTCGGTGAKPGSQPVQCRRCNGHGVVIQGQGFFRIQQTCSACRGQGVVISEPCETCRGHGVVEVERTSDEKGGDQVECAVFAPDKVKQGEDVFIQAFAFLAGNEAEAATRAREFDKEAVQRGLVALEVQLRPGQRLRFHLSFRGVVVEEPIQELTWRGKTASVQFALTIPVDRPPGNLLGTLLISTDGVPVGRIGFKLTVVANHEQKTIGEAVSVGETASRFRKGFVSYSSKDRTEVIRRVQMLRPPVTDIQVFQDILDLEPGEPWAPILYQRIDECDIFLLFWSSNARKSDWVHREIERVRQRQGPDGLSPPTILPVIIEGPPPPEPPAELAHLHFNDYLLYLAR